MRSDEMRDWFDEHGQVSGRRRAWALKIPAPTRPPKEDLDPRRSPKKYEAEVFMRDHYRCRYCGGPIVVKEALRAFERAVGTAVFRCVGLCFVLAREKASHLSCYFSYATDLGFKLDVAGIIAVEVSLQQERRR